MKQLVKGYSERPDIGLAIVLRVAVVIEPRLVFQMGAGAHGLHDFWRHVVGCTILVPHLLVNIKEACESEIRELNLHTLWL